MKALDALRQQRDNVQQAAERWTEYAEAARKDPTAAPGPETCQRRADEFTAKAATMDRIAKVVEAAQAWIETGTLIGIVIGQPADVRLRDAVAALDAENGQAAAPQEKGEHP